MIRGLVRLIRFLWRLRWHERIGKLPRIASSEYDHIDRDAARIMSRYGIRSPSGITAAMKKYKVKTVDHLVLKLEHRKAQRRIGKKWQEALRRLSGGTRQNPHTREIKQVENRPYDDELLQRIKRIRRNG
jgi:hypothetical protein